MKPLFVNWISAVLLGTGIIGCVGAIQINSSWNDRTITVDGVASDWGPTLQPITSPPVTLGVRNDKEFVYICLSTGDRFLQSQILNNGLTVWFDPQGGQEKTFGIRFPVHQGDNTPRWSPREPLAVGLQILSSFHELEILGPGEDDAELVSVVEATGIKLKMGATENTLVYELQVPLSQSGGMRHAVGIGQTSTMGIGFETPDLTADRLQGPSGRSSASTGGRGRRRGGGAAAGEADFGGAGPEALHLWTNVVLSTP